MGLGEQTAVLYDLHAHTHAGKEFVEIKLSMQSYYEYVPFPIPRHLARNGALGTNGRFILAR